MQKGTLAAGVLTGAGHGDAGRADEDIAG